MRFLYTKYLIVGLLVIGLLDGLQLSKRCVSLILSMQIAVFWLLAYQVVYIIQKTYFSCFEYVIIGCLVADLSDSLQLSKKCFFFVLNIQLLLLACWTVFNHPKDTDGSFLVVGLLNDLQLSKKYFFSILNMQMAVSQLLAYWMVYYYPKDIFFLY